MAINVSFVSSIKGGPSDRDSKDERDSLTPSLGIVICPARTDPTFIRTETRFFDTVLTCTEKPEIVKPDGEATRLAEVALEKSPRGLRFNPWSLT